jgi:hypothetical protein
MGNVDRGAQDIIQKSFLTSSLGRRPAEILFLLRNEDIEDVQYIEEVGRGRDAIKYIMPEKFHTLLCQLQSVALFDV